MSGTISGTSPIPQPRNVSQIKSFLLKPAFTSTYEVSINIPTGKSNFVGYLKANGISTVNSELLTLSCSEASLPGSNLTTHEINNDFHGVTERHAYRRVYDDRMDLTFYVDSEEYYTLRFFEIWMKFIANESQASVEGGVGVNAREYAYRMKYPDEYMGSFRVVKFEKSKGGSRLAQREYTLTYNFIGAFPISITSIPLSYDSSDLLKVTVSMTYLRYFLDSNSTGALRLEDIATQSPDAQAASNASQFENPQFGTAEIQNSLSGTGALATNTGGVPTQAANSAGNSVDRRVEAGLPYIGRNIGPISPFSGI